MNAPSPQAAPQGRLSRLARFRGFVASVCSTRLDRSYSRIGLVAVGFILVYGVIIGRLIMLGIQGEPPPGVRIAGSDLTSGARPDIIDRNGDVLATDVKTMSVFAEPRRIVDKDEAVELLTAVLPDLDATDLRNKLGTKRGFIWVKRHITARQREEVHRLGLPGIGFLPENTRVYPNGPVAAHVLGYTNIDNAGIAGIEKYIDGQGLAALHTAGFDIAASDLKPVQLSLDMRVTHALRDELVQGMERYKASGAAGAILDVKSGEVIALVSLPDYNPNNPVDALDLNRINRMTVGTYEMGSTFKSITIAMALESNKVNINSRLDARQSLRYGRFKIRDFHAQSRVLTVPEVFTYSSNIGTARMALMVGVEGHQAFLRKVGQLDRLVTELPENANPIIPRRWGELNTVTIAFGQGLNVAPLQALMAVGALVNGGNLIKPTFLKRSAEEAMTGARRIVRPEVSETMRYLLRLNAEIGSARLANVPGYYVGGKTGTADKIINGRYARDRVFTTFTAITPADNPKYLTLVLYDDPKGLPSDGGYRTAAYNAGRTTGKLLERFGPLIGLPPRLELPQHPFPTLARMGIGTSLASGSTQR